MAEIPDFVQTNSDPILLGFVQAKPKRSKRYPNCPLVRGPFIKIKIECKHLELLNKSKSLENIYQSNENMTYALAAGKDSLSDKKSIFNMSRTSEYLINPFVKINLNEQENITNPINHNNPKWLTAYEYEINNYKNDKIFFEIHNLVKGEKRTFNDENTENLYSEEFLGFQVLPIKYLEKCNLIGHENQLVLRLIDRKPNEYFVDDERHVLHLENHDPVNYKLDEAILKENNDCNNPILYAIYFGKNFYFFIYFYLPKIN